MSNFPGSHGGWGWGLKERYLISRCDSTAQQPLIDSFSALVTHRLQLTIVGSEGGKWETSEKKCVRENVLF